MKAFEHEFLIRLAPIWLACRWKVMGHELENWPYESDLAYDLLGMVDYANEMKELCKENAERNRYPVRP